MSTSIAIAAAANTSALIAQQQAAESSKMACQAWMPNYTHATATLEKMHAYAECVNRLYPESMPTNDLIVLKVAVALLFIGTFIGVWRGMSDYEGPIINGLYGLCFTLTIEIVLFLIGAGLVFLFT